MFNKAYKVNKYIKSSQEWRNTPDLWEFVDDKNL